MDKKVDLDASAVRPAGNKAILTRIEFKPVIAPVPVIVPIIVWLLLLLWSHQGTLAMQATGSTSAVSDNNLIRSEFHAICKQSRQRQNPFYSDAKLESLEKRLTEPFPGELAEAEARGRLAFEYIRTGKFEKALEMTSKALEIVDRQSRPIPGMWGYLKEIEAAAHFQAAEDENCLQLHNHASCVLPLAESAVHELPENARSAKRASLDLLARNPNRVSAQWLANLSALLAGEGIDQLPAQLRLPEKAFAGSGVELAPWLDIGPSVLDSAPDLAGGAVVDDFDGDGYLDLISSSMDPCAPLQAFRNTEAPEGVDGVPAANLRTFEEVTGAWGLDVQLGGLNIVHADFDNDGHLDLLVLRGAWFGSEGRVRNSLLLNRLSTLGTFVDVTVQAGLAYPAYPTQAAAVGDFDGDGDLDLVIGNEAQNIVIDPSQASNSVTNGHPLQLFRNLLNDESKTGSPPQLRFVDITRQAGLTDHSFTKGVAWGDIDNDGDLDLYLSNFGPNRLFRNDSEPGRPRFADITEEAGVAGGDRRTFATWFFDFDQDGDQDLFAASYNVPAQVVAGDLLGLELTEEAKQVPPDRLRSNPIIFRNLGKNPDGELRFSDVSEELGLSKPILAMGANFGDIDNDGFPDIYLGTGMPDFSAIHPNIVLRNEAGKTFRELTYDLGMAHLQKGHGVAFADLDHDGDLDLFHQLGGAFPYDVFPNALFRNPLDPTDSEGTSWTVLSLRGKADNHFGLGARVAATLETPNGIRTVFASVTAGGSFGASTLRLHLGLGDAKAIRSITVYWPTGVTETFTGGEINRYYLLLQGTGELRPLDSPSTSWRPRSRSASHP